MTAFRSVVKLMLQMGQVSFVARFLGELAKSMSRFAPVRLMDVLQNRPPGTAESFRSATSFTDVNAENII
jgi:hypothetical protein